MKFFTEPLPLLDQPNVIFRNGLRNISDPTGIIHEDFFGALKDLFNLIVLLSEGIVLSDKLDLTGGDDVYVIKSASFCNYRLTWHELLLLKAREDSLLLLQSV